MGYKKPIPVEINKIVIGKKYYTCSYSGTISVIILKIFKDTNSVLVKINSKKKESNPFVRHMNYIFDNPEMAKFAGRTWEHDERKRKKEQKKKQKEKCKGE